MVWNWLVVEDLHMAAGIQNLLWSGVVLLVRGEEIGMHREYDEDK